MKKIATIIMVFLMILGMAACSPKTPQQSAIPLPESIIPTDSTGGADTPTDINVAYLANNTVDAFHVTLNDAAKTALDEMQEEGVVASWQLYDGLTDPITQVNLIEDAINNGANFVVFLPVEGEGSAPVVSRCAELGIPIVVVNSKTNNTDQFAAAFVGPYNVEAGEIMAKYVQEQVPDGGKYIHIMGVIGDSAQIDIGHGIKNILDADEKWESAGDFPADWAADRAVQFATGAITEYGDDLKAILCDNDDMASDVQAYCNFIDRSDIVCIGVGGEAGALAMVKEGALGATVFEEGTKQIEEAIALIPDIIAGREVEKVMMVPFTLVTSENVDEYL
ncbi:MAG: substrate-binding domain-containing protein [Christensenellales bacterium]|jgi:inositol transport system substrate-binding protein